MFNLGPVWGLDVGDSALKAVKLKRVGNQIVLLDFQIIRYGDISGEVGARRDANLPQVLAALRAAGLRREPCTVSIAPQTIFSRFISLPPVDKRRIPEIVLYEARQQIPFNLDEVIWAYQAIRREFIPGEEIEIGLFAIKREVVDAYLDELSPVSAQLDGLQVAPLALYNFIRYDIPLEEPTVVMDIGAQSTDLLIVAGDKFWLRNLPIAGNSFTALLQKRLNIPRDEAEKLKHSIAESRHRRKLLEVLRPIMRDLVGEIQRSIGYYKSLSQDVKFDEILITGEGYKLFGLDRFLAEQLQYRVTPIQQLQKLLFQGSPDRVDEFSAAIPSLGVAIGLALQGLHRASATINLLPDDFVIHRELRRKRFTGLVAAALVCATVGCFYFKGYSTSKEIASVKDKGKRTLIELTERNKDYKDAEKTGDARLPLFEGFGDNREYDARVIGAMARVVPKGISIDSFTLTHGTLGALGRGARAGGRDRSGGPSSGEEGVAEAFTATCDAVKEPRELRERLPKRLETATIYREEVRIVKGVQVGEISVIRSARGFAGMSGDDSAAAGDEWLTARIVVGLMTVEEAVAKRNEISASKKHEAERAATPFAREAAANASSDGT